MTNLEGGSSEKIKVHKENGICNFSREEREILKKYSRVSDPVEIDKTWFVRRTQIALARRLLTDYHCTSIS